jgi:folate-dependent phosphoribosylglycinamide formyltransferase PurN
METSVPRFAVMISGGGRTMLNLHEQMEAGRLPGSIALVIASADCPGVERARAAGLDCIVKPGVIPAHELESLLAPQSIDAVILAGYLKFVHVPPRMQGRVVNIHPSLLPRHGGKGMFGHHVHQAVLDARERLSGCTVHIVDDEYDHGRVVLRRTCEVRPDDTAATLADRVFEIEKLAYPEALRQLCASWGLIRR